MARTPRSVDDGEEPRRSVFEEQNGVLVSQEESDVYAGDWQDPDAGAYTQGGKAPLTTIATGNGRARVRNNVPLEFNVGTIIFGSFSGTVPAGAELEGADSNHNGIPDRLEKGFKDGSVRVRKDPQ